MIFHPSRRFLLRWADGARARWTDHHLGRCDVCSARLDAMTTLDSPMLDVLREILKPPPDFLGRLRTGLQAKMLEHETATLMGELFGAGIETTRLLLEGDDTVDG
jgi:hypothetical protein